MKLFCMHVREEFAFSGHPGRIIESMVEYSPLPKMVRFRDFCQCKPNLCQANGSRGMNLFLKSLEILNLYPLHKEEVYVLKTMIDISGTFCLTEI